MIYSTRGIVLRSIKYGETSIVATIYTELFGIQSYLVNGVRSQGKSSKAHYFQPASLLDLEVYHNDLKNLQRVKELKWSVLYKNILSDVIKNSVALYMVELLYKCLKQPEANADLFHFCEDAFLELDKASELITANFPLYFSTHLPQFFGLQLQDNYSGIKNEFNVKEGKFSEHDPAVSSQVNAENSYLISQILKVIHPVHLDEIKMNRNTRMALLKILETYYAWHIPDFSSLKTLAVLHEVL